MTAAMVARKVLGVAAGAASTPVASVVYNAELHRKCSGFLSLSSSSVIPALGLGSELRSWRRRKWTSTSSRRRSENGGVVAMVAVPFRPLTLPTEEPEAAEDDDDDDEKKREFDPSAIPPFTLADIRAAIPKHCWEKNVWKSMSFVARDVAIVFGLAAGAAYLNTWFVWPLYWLAQGTMFWALFVLGHDWCAVVSEPASFCCFPPPSFLPSSSGLHRSFQEKNAPSSSSSSSSSVQWASLLQNV